MIGKAAIFLKHRAGKIGSKVGGMFRGRDLKNKATIAKFKANKKIEKGMDIMKKNPKKSIAAGAVGVAGLASFLDGGGRQKMEIEMKKISKEGKTRNISRQEIKSRLAKY